MDNMNLSDKEEIILMELKYCLKVFKDYFNIGSFYNDMVCLEQYHDSNGSSKYEVYDAEHNEKHNIKTYNTITKASLEMIERLSTSYEEEIQLLREFLIEISSWEIKGGYKE